jgi:hypothetical protein
MLIEEPKRGDPLRCATNEKGDLITCLHPQAHFRAPLEARNEVRLVSQAESADLQPLFRVPAACSTDRKQPQIDQKRIWCLANHEAQSIFTEQIVEK